MSKRNRAWIALVAAGLAAACLGCENETPKPEPKAKETAAESSAPAAPMPVAAKPTASEPAPRAPAGKEKKPVSGLSATAGLPSSVAGTAGQASSGARVSAKGKEPVAAPKKAVPAELVQERLPPLPPPAETPRQAPPPSPRGIPKVLMAEKDARTCLAKVGGVLPDATLPDLVGKKRRLRDLYGPRLTIVFFWNAEGPYGIEELQDMCGLCEPFFGKGLQVVGVESGDSAVPSPKNADAAAFFFPILLDADGALLAKVARARLPRTYLLDASGKILWFDMEYSRSTRVDLVQAMKAVTGK